MVLKPPDPEQTVLHKRLGSKDKLQAPPSSKHCERTVLDKFWPAVLINLASLQFSYYQRPGILSVFWFYRQRISKVTD